MTNRQIEADIEHFKACLVDADIEDVEAPSSVKSVEIAWQDDKFHVEQGEAFGVYHEPERGNAETVHIDWADDRSRTTVPTEKLITLDESCYRTDV